MLKKGRLKGFSDGLVVYIPQPFLNKSLVVKVSGYFNKQFVPSSFILHIQVNAS